MYTYHFESRNGLRIIKIILSSFELEDISEAVNRLPSKFDFFKKGFLRIVNSEGRCRTPDKYDLEVCSNADSTYRVLWLYPEDLEVFAMFSLLGVFSVADIYELLDEEVEDTNE